MKQIPSLDDLREDAIQEQNRELAENYAKLSLEGRAQVVIFSRQLLEKEEEAKLRKQLLESFDKLNNKGKVLALQYMEALAANPKYRKAVPK